MTKQLSSLDNARRARLDGLMASDLNSLERSIYRRLLFTGTELPDAMPGVQKAMASLCDAVGCSYEGSRGQERQPGLINTKVRDAANRLKALGLITAQRKHNGFSTDGPRTPYLWRLPADVFAEAREAKNSRAFLAIRTMSLSASKLGPRLEDTLCKLWYAVPDREPAEMCQRPAEWADLLGITRNTAEKRLRELDAAGVGVSFRVVPPFEGEHHRTIRWAVCLRLPRLVELGGAPSGAARLERAQTALNNELRGEGRRMEHGQQQQAPRAYEEDDESLPDFLRDDAPVIPTVAQRLAYERGRLALEDECLPADFLPDEAPAVEPTTLADPDIFNIA
jgi:hypothetical protein